MDQKKLVKPKKGPESSIRTGLLAKDCLSSICPTFAGFKYKYHQVALANPCLASENGWMCMISVRIDALNARHPSPKAFYKHHHQQYGHHHHYHQQDAT
jgi:hypothetical protein